MDKQPGLQLAKKFVELSILMSNDKKFLLPIYDKNNKHQTVLYKAISELKKEGIINVNSTQEGAMVITFRNKVRKKAFDNF